MATVLFILAVFSKYLVPQIPKVSVLPLNMRKGNEDIFIFDTENRRKLRQSIQVWTTHDVYFYYIQDIYTKKKQQNMFFLLLSLLDGMAHTNDIILAPVECFGLWQRPFFVYFFKTKYCIPGPLFLLLALVWFWKKRKNIKKG